MTWLDDLEGLDYSRELAFEAMLGPARGYAIARWNLSNNVYFHPEDRAAIAWLALTEVINQLDEGSIDFRAWTWVWACVKNRVDSGITNAKAKWATRITDFRSISPRPEFPNADPAAVFTSLRTQQHDGLLLRQLADVIALLPRVNKIPLALFFFEGMSSRQIGGMVGATDKPARTWIHNNTAYLLHHAMRLVLDKGPNDVPRVPAIREDYETPLQDAAEAYVQETYGCDLPSWLGWVQIAYRVDVSYILDMLDSGNGIKVQPSLRAVKLDYDADANILDGLNPPPSSVADVAARTGWAESRSRYAIATWRTRHGIQAPKNGAEAKAAASDAGRTLVA
ncbi:hypothetical protein [Microbacterium dauci]|uniref:Uncharacterized protein n=1 Tax=Microbacterium dauci TaxID=3048008 RepID=A0ABT6ZID5_9MICO|nr:hypothetical protein [Microbacterium sp. LX3-4]MDJ1115382.1 hypothetical protein [Microbacterium sp. LX3-4]